MASEFLRNKAQQQRESMAGGGSTGTVRASSFLQERAAKQRAQIEERQKNRSADRSALDAIGDRAVLDFIEKASKPQMVTPVEEKQKNNAQAFPQLPTFGNNVQNTLQQNANKMPLAMQGERSAEVKWQKAAMDLSAAEQKLLSMEPELQRVEAQGAKIQEQGDRLQKTYENLMQLKQGYETTGDFVLGQAYLVAAEQYSKELEAYQKDYAGYEKAAKAFEDYNRMVTDLEKKRLDYETAYQNWQAGELAKRPENKSDQDIEGIIADLDNQIAAAEEMVYMRRRLGEYENRQEARARLDEANRELAELQQQRTYWQGYLEQRQAKEWEEETTKEILNFGGSELMTALLNYAKEIEFGQRFTFDKGVAAAAKTLKDMGITDEQLDKWMPYARRMVNAQNYNRQTETAKEMAQSSRAAEVAMSVASVPYQLMSGTGVLGVTLKKLEQKITGDETPINYQSRGMVNYGIADAIRTGVAENIEARTEGKLGSDTALGNLYSGGYQLLMSMADSLGVVGLTALGVPGATVLLGGSAATATMVEVKERGGSDAQALTMGYLAGAAETLFEEVSIDKLLKTKAPSDWKTAIGNILKQGLTEGTEEVSTTVANTLAEMIVMGDKNQLQMMVQEYMAQGMSREDAEREAAMQWGVGLLADFIGGAVSGGLFGAGSNVLTADYRKKNASVKTDNASVKTDNASVKTDNATDGAAAEIATAPAEPRNDNTVDEGIQWAGNTPEIDAERVVNNEETEQRTELGQSGNAGQRTGTAAGTGGQTARRESARATLRRAEAANRIQANVQTLGGNLTSLREQGLSIGTSDRILTTVEREAWTQDVEEAWEIAESEGLEFVPLVGNMQVQTAGGKTVTITGVIQNGRIYARADSTKQSIRETVLHEVFHDKAKKDPGLVRRVTQKIRETYTREQTQKMFERYYDLYQDAYGGTMTEEELELAIWEEMLADAYAEFQRYSDTFGAAEWSETVQQETWRGKTVDYGEDEEGKARFSVEEADDGEQITVINTGQRRFDEADAKQYAAIARRVVLNKFRNQVLPLGDQDLARVTKDTADEYAYPRKQYASDSLEYNAKMRAAPELDNLLQTAEYLNWDKDHTGHKEAELGFDYYKVKFIVDGHLFEGIANIANSQKGRVLYDITKIKEIPDTTGKYATLLAQSTSGFGDLANAAQELSRGVTVSGSLADTTSAAFTDSVQDSADGVKAKFSATESGRRDIKAELSGMVKPGLISGPHAVPRVEAEVAGHIVRPEGMSDEEYAELDAKWQERHQPGQNQAELTPVEDLIIPKADFTSTPAMDKLGIKIDGSVARYRQTEQLRAYEKAARQAQRMLNKRIKDLKPSGQDLFLARGLVDGNITAAALDDDNVNVGVITELADYLLATRSFSEDMIAQRRGEINTANYRIAETLFQDSDAYHPKLKLAGLTKIVMNERTPERVVKQIFGQEQGSKIYETYFRPVWVNGAEMNRFENRMLDRVAKFEDRTGTKRVMTEAERAMAQRLMEGEAARDNVARLDQDTRERVEAAAKNVNNGDEFVDAVREFNLTEEYHQGLVQAYADYLDTVTMSKDMDQTILKNAIQTYQQIYNEMYDAINDFLVSHGYNEIGFIKGYAPHFQKREAQQGLFGALKALGVEKESVSELPASIAGRTADFKPNMKWNPHMQSRKGSDTSYDIQQGFEQYLHYAAEMFYHTDDVMRIRQAVNWFRGEYAGETISQAIEDAQVDRYKSVEWKKAFLEQHELIETGRQYEARAINKLYDEYVSGLFEKASPENLQKYSEFVTWLDNYANIVAGKQSLADRGLEYGGGRNALNMGSKLMRRFSAANVAGNLSSVLNQSAQLPLIQQQLGSYLERAVFDMARGGIAKDNFVERSDFLTDKRGVDKLTMDTGEKFISALFKPAELMDRLVSTVAVRGRYLQALSEGMTAEQAMKEADDFGRRVMGSRMKGAKPLGFESKTFVNQMLHVFQVEAANTFDYMVLSDMPQAVRETAKTKGKAAAARHVAGYVVGYLMNAFLLNRMTDELYGGSPAPFDLMGWALNFAASGFGRTDEDFLKLLIDNVWERMFGERPFETERLRDEAGGIQWAGNTAFDDLSYNVLNDVPYVRNAMGLLGLGDQTLPTVGINEFAENVGSAGKTLWDQIWKGEEETGISWAGAARSIREDLLNAAAQILPGGRQIKKSVQGALALRDSGKYSGDRLQYPVEQNIQNAIQAILFGPSALEAADEYYAEGLASLTAGQTQKVEELEGMGIDRRVTYDLYQQFREINKELTGTEASTAKRNAINTLNLTDQEKLEVYAAFIMDKSSETYEKNRAQFQAMLDAGLSWDEVTQANNIHAMLNEDEEMMASEKATEFAKWVDQQGWNEGQKTAVEEKFKFWQMMPAQAATYEKMETAGLEPEKAADITGLLANLEPEEGKETVTTNQKILAINGSDFSDEEKVAAIAALVPDKRERLVEAGVSDPSARDMAAQLALAEAINGEEELGYVEKMKVLLKQAANDKEALAAASTVLQESTYQKVEIADDFGVPVEYWVDYREAWNKKYGEDSVSQEKVQNVLDGMRLSNEEKAVLWQIANKSWKPKNNPYSRSIGEEVYWMLNEE